MNFTESVPEIEQRHHNISGMALGIRDNVCKKFRVLTNPIHLGPESFLNFSVNVVVLHEKVVYSVLHDG